MALAIKVENVGKKYRLGTINRDMLYKDIQSWWAKMRGKPDPNAKISFIHQNRLEKGDEFWAIRNVSLEIQEGEVYGIIGRNGAGKSTLLKILSQITAPTEGQIKMKGRVASLLEVGTGFHPELTGRENVFLNGAILGMSRREIKSKFDEIVGFSEIKEFIDTPVKRYSSGMYVRLAFGVAAHLDPDVLIVDEVLAVGDAGFQKKCIGKMNSVAGEGKTVILVTHSMALARSLTKRCAWMDQGCVRQIGSTDEVIETYLANSDSSYISATEGLGNHKLRRGPGHARIDSLTVRDVEGVLKNRFHRGEKIFVDISLKSFKRCDGLVLLIGLKLGAAGVLLMTTAKEKVTEKVISPDTEIRVTFELDSSQIPAADYDTYLWLGPANAVCDEYYDCVDSMLPPLTIVERNADPEARTPIPVGLSAVSLKEASNC